MEDSLQNLGDRHSMSSLKETFECLSDEGGLDGVLNFFDTSTGRLVMRKKNKVVLRGRTFAIENVWKKTVNPQVATGYIADLNRRVNFFKVGKGGTPVNDLFAPLPVSPTAEALNNEIPFQIVLPGGSLLATDPTSYVKSVVEGANTAYYGKQFDNRDPEMVFNKADNRIAMRMELSISQYDLRDKFINEIGLFFSSTTFNSPELYSKVHFPTEPFTGTKGLLVEYWAFA